MLMVSLIWDCLLHTELNLLVTFGYLCFGFLDLYSYTSIYIQLKKFSFHFVCLCR